MLVVRSKAKSRLEEFSQVIAVQSWSCVATRRSRVCGIKERLEIRSIVVKAGRFLEYWADSGGFEGGGNNGMGGAQIVGLEVGRLQMGRVCVYRRVTT